MLFHRGIKLIHVKLAEPGNYRVDGVSSLNISLLFYCILHQAGVPGVLYCLLFACIHPENPVSHELTGFFIYFYYKVSKNTFISNFYQSPDSCF